MAHPAHSQPRLTGDGWRQPLLFREETLLFLLASLLDLALTWHLLLHQDIEFVETNPFARFFLYGWGLQGLVAFKLALVAFITLLCHVIAHFRAQTARRVMQFGALVVSAVVIYSIVLLYNAHSLV